MALTSRCRQMNSSVERSFWWTLDNDDGNADESDDDDSDDNDDNDDMTFGQQREVKMFREVMRASNPNGRRGIGLFQG